MEEAAREFMESRMKVTPAAGDALLVTDVQNDFLPGGSLAVPGGDEIIPVLNRYIGYFHTRGLPIYATRDWHPADHCSFLQRGGQWPPHCIAGTSGAAFSSSLDLPSDAYIISKATDREKEAYSGFEGTVLNTLLSSSGIRRLFVGGLTAEYCVRSTVEDALRHHYVTFVLKDAIRAIHPHSNLGQALEEMKQLGAIPVDFESLAA